MQQKKVGIRAAKEGWDTGSKTKVGIRAAKEGWDTCSKRRLGYVQHGSVSFVIFERVPLNRIPTLHRGTQRIVSVECLFGRPGIASRDGISLTENLPHFRLGKCHLELS